VVEEAAAGADLLVHDATFADDERGRARSTGHPTAAEAAELAARAGARRLALTHVSARYASDASPLEREAREALADAGSDAEAFVATDGQVVDVPFPDA
jgi:ribonuclease Z